ncbi:hypothetical protein BJX76DRAFT_185238 [Aspergillus varians]
MPALSGHPSIYPSLFLFLFLCRVSKNTIDTYHSCECRIYAMSLTQLFCILMFFFYIHLGLFRCILPLFFSIPNCIVFNLSSWFRRSKPSNHQHVAY